MVLYKMDWTKAQHIENRKETKAENKQNILLNDKKEKKTIKNVHLITYQCHFKQNVDHLFSHKLIYVPLYYALCSNQQP